LSEFGRLINILNYYNDLYSQFQQLDTNNDKRISYSEFKKGHELVGLHVSSDDELKAEFNKIDTNNGEFILFDEVK
jgi:Ca2+-binding EF-hand superfamily protein